MATQTKTKGGGAALGFEARLWTAADKLRGAMHSAERTHILLGHTLLAALSDASEKRWQFLLVTAGNHNNKLSGSLLSLTARTVAGVA